MPFFQDIRGRYPPQGIKQLWQWPPTQIQMFPEQKSIWILVISQLYLEALKLFNLYLVLCVWLVDHLQENMCKFFFELFTISRNHEFTKSQDQEFTNSWMSVNLYLLFCMWHMDHLQENKFLTKSKYLSCS